jgi:hypothetical protein
MARAYTSAKYIKIAVIIRVCRKNESGERAASHLVRFGKTLNNGFGTGLFILTTCFANDLPALMRCAVLPARRQMAVSQSGY